MAREPEQHAGLGLSASAASRNLSGCWSRGAFILSAPQPAPRRANPLFQREPTARRQVTWGWGSEPRSAQVEVAKLSQGVPAGPGRALPSPSPCRAPTPWRIQGPRGAQESPARSVSSGGGAGRALLAWAPPGRGRLCTCTKRKPAVLEPQRTRSCWRLAAPHWTGEGCSTQKRKLERQLRKMPGTRVRRSAVERP